MEFGLLLSKLLDKAPQRIWFDAIVTAFGKFVELTLI